VSLARSRYAVASHVGSSQTAQDAIAVADNAIAARGVPRRATASIGTKPRSSSPSTGVNGGEQSLLSQRTDLPR
jgi:hypothetical protein